jgi:protein TonB
MHTALFEFMPYGAPDLIDGAGQRTFRATLSSIVLWIALFVAAAMLLLLRPTTVQVSPTVIVPYRELAAPPPLTANAPPPQVAVMPTAATPAMGVPVPVPDAQAPVEQTIASLEEIATATPSVEQGSGSAPIVVQPPQPEELPKLGDYVYADELPVLVKDVVPKYPELARGAMVEGSVLLRVLVGKDGRVLDVHVDGSIPLLDAAAVEAARQWVFKPALSNNRPVAVWVARKVRFSLTTV